MIVYTEVRYDTYVGFISSIHTEQMPYSNIKFSNSEGYKPLYTQPAPRPTQEPVAWMHCVDEDITEFNDFQACPKCEPLYTHPPKMEKVTRLEVIDADGRSYTNWKVKDIEVSYQDDGRTLKIFIK